MWGDQRGAINAGRSTRGGQRGAINAGRSTRAITMGHQRGRSTWAVGLARARPSAERWARGVVRTSPRPSVLSARRSLVTPQCCLDPDPQCFLVPPQCYLGPACGGSRCAPGCDGTAGTLDLLADLLKDPALTANTRAKLGLDDMALLLDYLGVFGVLGNVRALPGTVRGL